MKNILKIMVVGILGFFINSCTTQTNISPEKVNSLLQAKEFTFLAERANPTNYDVISVMNSLPNSSASRILNLDYGYTLELKKDQLKVELPYFGRMYTPTYSLDNNSFRLTSKVFTLAQKEGKKGSRIFTIVPKDEQNVRKIVLEVYKNGKSYLTVDSNDRQLISYDGYIMENIPEKK